MDPETKKALSNLIESIKAVRFYQAQLRELDASPIKESLHLLITSSLVSLNNQERNLCNHLTIEVDKVMKQRKWKNNELALLEKVAEYMERDFTEWETYSLPAPATTASHFHFFKWLMERGTRCGKQFTLMVVDLFFKAAICHFIGRKLIQSSIGNTDKDDGLKKHVQKVLEDTMKDE